MVLPPSLFWQWKTGNKYQIWYWLPVSHCQNRLGDKTTSRNFVISSTTEVRARSGSSLINIVVLKRSELLNTPVIRPVWLWQWISHPLYPHILMTSIYQILDWFPPPNVDPIWWTSVHLLTFVPIIDWLINQLILGSSCRREDSTTEVNSLTWPMKVSFGIRRDYHPGLFQKWKRSKSSFCQQDLLLFTKNTWRKP